ncbi:hypothetical protein EDB19DRAFT_2043800 [Suillus lakei]|nr:hypothetical protein EDB19DRAFT_2043800 [Suillus lakei]
MLGMHALNNSRKRTATREWDTPAWEQVDHPFASTLVASASSDSHLRLRRLSDQRTIATFQHSSSVPKDASRHQLHVSVDPPPLCHIISRHFAAKAQIFSIDAKSVPIQPSLILNSTSGTIFAHRSKAKLEKMLWEDALLDAQKVIELEPSSHVGYHLKHTALHGARCYREAVDAFQMMHAKLASAHSMQIRKLCETYIGPSKAKGAI